MPVWTTVFVFRTRRIRVDYLLAGIARVVGPLAFLAVVVADVVGIILLKLVFGVACAESDFPIDQGFFHGKSNRLASKSKKPLEIGHTAAAPHIANGVPASSFSAADSYKVENETPACPHRQMTI